MGGLFGGGGQNITTTAPIISGFRVQSSAYAGAIARIFGKTRVAANLMWYGDFTPIPHVTTTSSRGGKGGGSKKVTQTTVTYTYTAAALLLIGRGVINAVPRVWRDKKQTTLAALGLSLYTGNASQTPFPHLSSNHPGEALAYRGLAYLASAALDLGDSASLPNHTFEVEGELPFSEVIKDANPRDVVEALLLEAGLAAEFIGNLTAFSNYCVANSIFIAPAYTQQQSAAEAVAALARIGNAEVVCSEELIKLVPYSDQAVTGNGVTYTPDVAPLFEFTDDDFLSSDGESPVRFEDDDTSDAYNIVTVQYYNRAKDYAEDVVQARDDDNIALYGERPMDPIVLHEIVDTVVARRVAQVVLQQQIYYRMRYRFSLGPGKADLLEPMDVVAITDAQLGLAALPVRILEIEEIEDEERDGFRFYVREFPAGAGSAVVYPSESGVGYSVDYNVDPGNALPPVVIEPPVELTTTGLELWVGVTGPADSVWGGAHVWISLDGTDYQRVGTTRGPARIGHLTASLGAGSSGPAAVQLDGLGGIMTPVTAEDAAALATVLYIAGATPEYITYQGAELTGVNAYSLTTLTRGIYGSPDAAHDTGAAVARIDAAIVKGDPLDFDWIGRTVFIKLQSFNIFDGGLQDLADLTPHTYVVTGAMAKLPPPDVTGFTATASADRILLSWDLQTIPDFRHVEIRTDENWGAQDAAHVGTVDATTIKLLPLPVGSYTWRIRAIDRLGNYSTNSATTTLVVAAPSSVAPGAAIDGANLILTWPAPVADFAMSGYEVSHGDEFGSATIVASGLQALTFSILARWSGTRRWWVRATDQAGNPGAAGFVDVTITAPGVTGFSAQVIDNNVLLYWTGVPGTLPIDTFEFRRGATWDGATVIGTKSGAFTSVFETAGGVYTYWCAAIDAADNYGTPVSLTVTVSQPPDYVLKDNYDSDFSGTLVNMYQEGADYLVPVDATETFAAHFTANSWSTPQDQIDAGYPLYIQPNLSPGSYTETIDYGTLLASNKITVTLNAQTVSGTVTPDCTISVSADGTSWTDYTGTWQAYATNFRYVKIDIDFTAAGNADVLRVLGINVRLDSKLKTITRSVACNSADSGGTTVYLTDDETSGGVKLFLDVDAIQVTALGTTPVIAIYDFTDVPEPLSFKVLLFNTAGTRVSGTASVTVRGF